MNDCAPAKDGQLLVIIDDDTAFVEVLADMLQEHGYRVRVAPTAREGLELVQSALPFAVLLDSTLPDMNGVEALKLLKLDIRTTDVPIVLISGHLLEARDHPLAAVVIGKPFQSGTLLQTLARLSGALE